MSLTKSNIEFVNSMLKHCTLCPRKCGVDRTNSQKGFCGMTDEVVVARAALHFWEEPCISGENGSGTVFFSGCNLKCVYCQNKAISRGESGISISTERLAQIFLELQQKGALNINLVTPTHFIPQIILAIDIARNSGLKLPIVYNSSGYESVKALKMLDGYVDIYLPDLKYYDEEYSKRYSSAEDYFYYARLAIAEMVRQTGAPIFDDDGIMKRGTIVRHLVLPTLGSDSKKILSHIYGEYHDDILISIMSQYTPFGDLSEYPELNRKLKKSEYNRLLDYADKLGIENGFIQEGDAADESFIPDFDNEGVVG